MKTVYHLLSVHRDHWLAVKNAHSNRDSVGLGEEGERVCVSIQGK